MNRRLLLNVIIFSLLTFYMIFNVVYTRLLNKHEPELEAETQQEVLVDVWQQQVMVPNTWHLKRLETSAFTLQLDANLQWSEKNQKVDTLQATAIAAAWQNFESGAIITYQQLPLEGETILAFVDEDSQPLVFRLTVDNENVYFYRMIDQKRFSFPLKSESQFLVLSPIQF